MSPRVARDKDKERARRELEKEALEEDRQAAKALRALKLKPTEEPAFVFRPRGP